MTTFLDGPAAGTKLCLQRAPQLLRVVIAADGTVDALDQLNDEVRPGETVHVYRMHGDPSYYIACSRGKGGGCRPGVMAEYKLYDRQPTQEEAADNDRWHDWAHAQLVIPLPIPNP
jgi:hypothetical protein